jgi:hypothetical protein
MTEKVSEKRVKTKELKMLDNELSEKYEEDVLREAYERLES